MSRSVDGYADSPFEVAEGERVASDDLERWPTGRLVSSVARSVEREWNAYLATWQITHSSLPILATLLRGDCSQRELADLMHVTEQTMSRLVHRLRRLEYVELGRLARDGRRTVVRLTSTGRSVALAAARLEVAEELVTRGLDDEEVAQLRGLLTKMLRELD